MLGDIERPFYVRFKKDTTFIHVPRPDIEFLVVAYDPTKDSICVGPDGHWWNLIELIEAEAEYNDAPGRGGSVWTRIGFTMQRGQMTRADVGQS